MPRLSIVIPAYDEEVRLGTSLRRILDYLRLRPETSEVIVVDDGSRDATAEVASSFAAEGVRLLRQPGNRGKGAALRAGVLASEGELVLLCDADLSTPIEDLAKLEAALGHADVVYGSREAKGAEISRRQPFYRVWMGRFFNLLVQALGVRGVRDTQCGFKLLCGAAARRLFAELTVDRFAYDVELLWLAREAGLRVAEVGVRWANSPDSRVHPARDSLSMLRDVVRLRLRRLRRKAGR